MSIPLSPSRKIRQFSIETAALSLCARRQFKAGQLLDLPQKGGGLYPERAADVEDAPQGRVRLPQLNETDEGSLVARSCRQSLLAHFLPQTMLPQQLSERRGGVEPGALLTGRGHTPMWHRKYITRRL